MKIIIGLFIFCLVLFLYLHVQFHLKTSDDLEMYEINEASKDKLEEICDLRQPVMFDFNSSKIEQTTCLSYLLANYPAFEIKIRNVKDADPNSELYMPLTIRNAVKLFDEDKNKTYLSEFNQDFLQETGVIKNMQYNDEYIRPYMVSNCNYDVMMGSEGVTTPFRYELNYRNFFLVTEGSIQIKLAPPKSIKYLYPHNDYENFEFRTPVNPWNPQPQYTADFDKIKCLEFPLTKGKIVYIPAYWWYSIKFNNNSSISCFRYRTYMNNIAISPHVGMYALQIQNIRRDVVKKVSINELEKTHIQPTNNSKETMNEKIDEDIITDIKDTTSIENIVSIESAPLGSSFIDNTTPIN